MDKASYESNSHKSKEKAIEEKMKTEEMAKVEKVINGKVKTKKKNGISKAANNFFEEDIRSVREYLCHEVLIPALKRMFVDLVNNGADMLAWGQPSGKSSRGAPGSKVSYQKYYDRREEPIPRSRRATGYGAVYDYDELIFEDRGDAIRVLDTLDEIIQRYGWARVADLYEAADQTPSMVMFNYGWTDLRTADVRRTRDGFIIDLPKPLPLD